MHFIYSKKLYARTVQATWFMKLDLRRDETLLAMTRQFNPSLIFSSYVIQFQFQESKHFFEFFVFQTRFTFKS